MGHPVEIITAVDTYGADGIPESIVMFNEGLEEVPEIASRNMRMGSTTETHVIFEDQAVTDLIETSSQ